MHQDSREGLDDEGRPVTIDAAKKLFHRNDNPLYFPKKNYLSKNDAILQLRQGK